MDLLHIARVAWFTFYQATLSTFIALLIGLPAAFFCGRRNFIGRRFLLSLSAVPFCIPSLIIALGYVTFLGVSGGLNHFLMFVFGFKEPPVRILYSFIGLIIAHGFYNFPLIMKNVSEAWGSLPSEPSDCARLLGASENRVFRTVTIFQLLPSIASSCMLVFIYCFLSFILVLLFGGIGNTTLEVEIYKAARASLNFSNAAVLSVIETLILCVITGFYCYLEQKGGKTKGLKIRSKRWGIKGWKERLFFGILLLLIILFFIAPLAGIMVNAFTSSQTGVTKGPAGFTFRTMSRVVKMRSFWPSFWSTVRIACCTGMVCTVIGFIFSLIFMILTGKVNKKVDILLKVLPMLPMCISSVVVGIILVAIIPKGTVVTLVLAQSFLSWPLAFRVIYPQLSKINRETLDSAKLLSRNRLDMILRVLLPVSGPSLVSAFGFCFAVSAGDTTLPLVLAIPKFNNLSLFTYRLAGSYKFNEACASGLILGLICAIVFTISSIIVHKRRVK